jgi:hypothetical protein
MGGLDGYSLSHIDDLRFYNKCLTQNELLTIMNLNTSKEILTFFVKYITVNLSFLSALALALR